jgi:hypothetical protein
MLVLVFCRWVYPLRLWWMDEWALSLGSGRATASLVTLSTALSHDLLYAGKTWLWKIFLQKIFSKFLDSLLTFTCQIWKSEWVSYWVRRDGVRCKSALVRIHKVTNGKCILSINFSMMKSEAENHSNVQDICPAFTKPDGSLTHSQSLDLFFSHMNASHTLTLFFFKIHFNIILPSTPMPWSDVFRLN